VLLILLLVSLLLVLAGWAISLGSWQLLGLYFTIAGSALTNTWNFEVNSFDPYYAH
jgi:hypothetical protein